MKIIIPLTGVFTLVTTSAWAWGANGHHTVGYIAMHFLAPKALHFVRSSLGPTYNESLGPAATWADEVKTTSEFSWSSILHFVDALDNPPTSCSVSQSRDCADNKCILGAIANYTARVVDTRLSATQRQEALKFLDHFIGDIGQPLHVEAVAAGGNGISVQCNGTTSNLHAVWDSGLINRLLASNYGNSVTTWANTLAARIKHGAYRSQAGTWITCSSTTATTSIEADISGLLSEQEITPLHCPLVWAEDSNKLDCSYVFSFDPAQDLCTSSYYDNAVPLIETQVAKQGYRLAAWLNVLFQGKTHLPHFP